MSIFAFKILSRLIQSTIGDLDRIPKSNEILTMPVEAQKSFQNFWVNFDCTFIDIYTTLLLLMRLRLLQDTKNIEPIANIQQRSSR